MDATRGRDIQPSLSLFFDPIFLLISGACLQPNCSFGTILVEMEGQSTSTVEGVQCDGDAKGQGPPASGLGAVVTPTAPAMFEQQRKCAEWHCPLVGNCISKAA